MERYILGASLNGETRNGINSNFKYLWGRTDEIPELRGDISSLRNDLNQQENEISMLSNLKSYVDQVLSEAQQVNDQNEDVSERLDTLVLESGTSDAETIDARGGFNVLRERLEATDDKLDGTPYNVKAFGAVGDGLADDTTAIQSAIDAANTDGVRRVFMGANRYKISAPILLNGCTLIGVPGNIYNANYVGTSIIADTKDFVAIKQGSVSAEDIKFGISDILVEGAEVGYELNYVINSTFNRLYARDCDVGYKLGDPSTVGSMFNIFNNLYTRGCRVGAISHSNEFFNNNIFNNGFISGEEDAFILKVDGGYGAVNNTFNNVEFRSPKGRGITLANTKNTVFNQPYFECGGNAIRIDSYSTFTLNNPIFGLFKSDNTNLDTSFVYGDSGLSMTLNGGNIFLTEENADTLFYDTSVSATHENIQVTKRLGLTGSASGFSMFSQSVKEIGFKVEERTITTPTVTVEAGETVEVPFDYDKPFDKVPSVVLLQMRGPSYNASNMNYILSGFTSTGGTIGVKNNSNAAKSVNFKVYARDF